MKKLAIIILMGCGLSGQAQTINPIDTSNITNLSLKGKEWIIAITALKKQGLDSTWTSRLEVLQDSVNRKITRFPGTRDQKANADITIENCWAKFALEAYKLYVSASYGLIFFNGTNAITKLSLITHPVYTALRLEYNNAISRDYNQILDRAIIETYRVVQ